MAEYDTWFNKTFGGSGAAADYDPGGYTGAKYDQTFQNLFQSPDSGTYGTTDFLDMTGQNTPIPESPNTGFAGTPPGGGDPIAAAISNAQHYAEGTRNVIGGWLADIANAAKKLFIEPPSTTRRFNPETREYETTTNEGGGLNSLGKTLLAGALQSIGTAAVAKWQTERASEEAAKTRRFSSTEKEKDRQFERDKLAEVNARKPYGTSAGLGTVRTGVGLINRGNA